MEVYKLALFYRPNLKVIQVHLKYFFTYFLFNDVKIIDSCWKLWIYNEGRSGWEHYANGHEDKIICRLRPIVSDHLTVIIEEIR